MSRLHRWVIFLTLWGVAGIAQDSSPLCTRDLSDPQEEIRLLTEIRAALSKESSTVELSTTASVPLEENDIGDAKDRATFSAFRYLITLASKQMVSAEQFSSMQETLSEKILKQSRLFVRTYLRTSSAEVCGTDYRLPITVTLKLDSLRQALMKYKILDVTLTIRTVTLRGVQTAHQAESIKAMLRKQIRNVERVVKRFQKRGVIEFLVETSSPVDDIVERLRGQSGQGDLPLFKIELRPSGAIDIELLKS